MQRVYILSGHTRDWEAYATWVHSAYLDEDKARDKEKEMNDFIASLPNGGKKRELADANGRIENWGIDEHIKWKNDCTKKLLKKDKKSKFYGFVAYYSIEAISITE